MEQIEYSDFKKLDMKVGIITKVERVPETENLYKLQVDIGKNIQIVTSLVPYYTEEELLNQKIIVLVNLKPTKFRGAFEMRKIESHSLRSNPTTRLFYMVAQNAPQAVLKKVCRTMVTANIVSSDGIHEKSVGISFFQ